MSNATAGSVIDDCGVGAIFIEQATDSSSEGMTRAKYARLVFATSRGFGNRVCRCYEGLEESVEQRLQFSFKEHGNDYHSDSATAPGDGQA